jgi:hypothetical protein
MALSAPIGAGNSVEIYALSSTGLFGTKVITLNKNVTQDYTGHPIKQSVVIDIDNKMDDSTFGGFLETYLSSVAVEESKVEYVDASFDTITSGLSYNTTNGKAFGYVWYGAAGTESPSKTKLLVGRGILSGDTGNSSYAGKGIGNYPVQITTVAGLAFECPAASLNSGKVTTTVAITGAATEYGTLKYVTTKT